MSIKNYNSEKEKWIEEYKNLSQEFKNEELSLLKLFLVKNYHLNKVYKKYVYKEKERKYNINETQKKIRIALNEKYEKENNEKFRNLINKIKEGSYKEYQNLIKEQNKIENDLKIFDYNTMMIYENDFDEWIKDKKFVILNNSDYDKDNISISINDKNEQKQNFNSTNYNTENDCIKNSELSFLFQDNKSNNLNDIIDCMNDKSKSLKLIDLKVLTPNKIESSFQFLENPIKNYLQKILKEINHIYTSKYNPKTVKNLNSLNNSILKSKEDEKNIINNIMIYLNKLSEDKNSLNYLNDEIKHINNIIKDELEGTYLGWAESEHKEFIKFRDIFKGKINSFLFLSNLNNLFPYMTVSKLKKHIKLYEIYLKIEKIKCLLTEKYNSLKKSFINDNRSSKQLNTSISATKSFSSYKVNKFNNTRKKEKSLDNKRNTTTINVGRINKIKINKDYFKITLKYKTKDNFYNKERIKRNNFNSLNVIRKRRNSNNFFFTKNK